MGEKQDDTTSHRRSGSVKEGPSAWYISADWTFSLLSDMTTDWTFSVLSDMTKIFLNRFIEHPFQCAGKKVTRHDQKIFGTGATISTAVSQTSCCGRW